MLMICNDGLLLIIKVVSNNVFKVVSKEERFFAQINHHKL